MRTCQDECRSVNPELGGIVYEARGHGRFLSLFGARGSETWTAYSLQRPTASAPR